MPEPPYVEPPRIEQPHEPPRFPPPTIAPPRIERSYSAPLKLLAGSAIGAVLACGLCGAALASHGSEQMAEIALGVFGISVLGLVVSVIWLIVVAVTTPSRR